MATVDKLSQPPTRAEMVETTASRSLARALLRTARPTQWAKNVLVFAAPGAAGVLTHGDVLADSIMALVAFCLAASGTYFLNDVADVEADRRHPTKRLRPIAAGEVPLRLAVLVGACSSRRAGRRPPRPAGSSSW